MSHCQGYKRYKIIKYQEVCMTTAVSWESPDSALSQEHEKCLG